VTDGVKRLLDRAVGWYEPSDALLDAARRRMQRRRIRRRVSSGALALVVSVLGVLLVWQAFQSSAGSPGFVDDTGWYRVGTVDDLRARRIVYVGEIETFVVTPPGEEPYALSAASPHLGERLLFCRPAGWFFSPAHGEMFDIRGNYELGPSDSGMNGRPVRIIGDEVEVDAGSEVAPAATAVGPADPEPSGPTCFAGTDNVVEDEPGFAGISGPLGRADQFPIDIVEGARPGDTLGNPGFIGAEVGFPATELVVRLVGVDGTVLDERLTSCDTACPGYAYADLIFTVEAPQRATILIGTRDGDSGVLWFHHIPVTLAPGPGVEPGSFVGTWYDEQGNPTYFKDERGWHLELHVINGAEHCGWQSASFLTLAWPVGSDFRGGEDGEDAARSYVRDPEGVLAGDFGVPPPDLAASLPGDASHSGYHRGDWQLWVSPSDIDEAVYLVAANGSVERWPRSGQPIACA
jgi:hypothetical protein